MEENIKFSNVGDIENKYSYLEVFVNGSSTSAIDVIITDNKDLCIKIYSNKNDIVLTIAQWEVIMREAQIFLTEEIKNEEFFDKFINSSDSLE